MSRPTPTPQRQIPTRKPLILSGSGSEHYRTRFTRLARHAWPILFPKRMKSSVSVAFLSATAMARVNEATRGREGATTVLAFPYENNDGLDPLVGEILLCLSAIRPWAREQGYSLEEATRRLFIHGLTHLAGYDHHTTADTRRMERIEDRLLTPPTRAI